MRAETVLVAAHRGANPHPLGSRSVGSMSAKANGRSAHRVQQSASNVRRDVEDLADAAEEQLGSMRQAAGAQAVRCWGQTLEDRIRQQPIQAVLAAAGLGIVVGLLLRR